MISNAMPVAADLTKILDAAGRSVKNLYASMGLGADGETGTYSVAVQSNLDKVLGDGAAEYGIANKVLAQMLQPGLLTNKQRGRYDLFLAGEMSWLLRVEQAIRDNMPKYKEGSVTKQWSMPSSTSRLLDLWLKRLNANSSDAPATASGVTPTLTATTGGSIPVGVGRRIKVSYVGTSPWMESLPSAAATLVAMAHPNSAYVIGGLAGNVPTGVSYLRVYCQLIGAGAGDPYYFCKDIPVVAGVAWSTCTLSLTEADSDLYEYIQPPSFNGSLVMPETAFAVALTMAVFDSVANQMKFSSLGMLSPTNVAMNPAGFYGYNPTTEYILGQWVGNGGSPATKTYATLRTANDATTGMQGFYGAANGVRARVTSALDDVAVISAITYTYFDAANPTVAQTGSLTGGSKTLSAALGSTVDLTIDAGRVVRGFSAITVGTATTGTFVLEPIVLRTL